MNFSLVIPVHNEASMLVYSLPSTYRLGAKEVIFVLDRCTDDTEHIIRKFWQKCYSNGGNIDLVLLNVKRKSNWRIHLNFLYDLGIRKAKSKIVLLSQADIIYDSTKIRENIQKASYGMVSFSVTEHPHIAPWNHFVTVTLQKLGVVFGLERFSGLFAFSKEHYLTCPLTAEDQLNFDTQLLMNFKVKGYPYIYVISKNLNMRPALIFRGESEKLLKVGADRYKMGKPFWNVLLLSIIRLTPEILLGYMQTKFYYTNVMV